VKVFVEMLKKRYSEVKVMVDSGFSSKRSVELYKQRRNIAIANREVLVPSCLSQYISEAFSDAGATVYHCVDDRENTLAVWATLDSADILSNDKDFYKFIGC